MYEIFYNFTAEPFRLSPDHRFCFEHNSYGKARAYLAYAFKRAEGFVMITGRPGTGKTTLIGELVESLSTDKVITANLVCTQLQADDLLKTVAYSFGVSPAQAGKAELLQQLSILLHSWHREGRRALLVVDEAQDLSSSAMEELRLLTNIQFGGQPLLQIFLLGQPELRDLILSREMEQVHQRIVAASHIDGLEPDETEAYVIHRLSRVGWQGDPAIDRAIFPLIHRFSEGVPRRINLICSRLFLLGSVEERHAIQVKDVSVVIGELQAENLAAGTGISREDFQNSAEPDWVPVPGAEEKQQDAGLQGAGSVPLAAVDTSSAEQPAPLKKKDNRNVETLVESGRDQIPETSSTPAEHSASMPQDGADNAPTGGLNPVVVDDPDSAQEANLASGVEDELDSVLEDELSGVPETEQDSVPEQELAAVPEREQDSGPEEESASLPEVGLVAGQSPGLEPASHVLAVSQDESLELYDAESDVEAGGVGVLSPVPRKRLIFMALLMGTTVVFFLLLKACFATQGEVSFPDAERGVSADEGQAFTPEETGSDQQELLPVAVAAGLRLKAPAVVTENTLSTKASRDGGQSGRDKPGARKLPEATPLDAVSVEIAAEESWQETILISFSFDSDGIAPDAHPLLDKAAKVLQENDSAVASIIGFTDEQGGSQYNLRLSRKRANAVKRYLIDAGVAPRRLHVEGRGILRDPVEGLVSGPDDPMEPYRIVQIKLVNEG